MKKVPIILLPVIPTNIINTGLLMNFDFMLKSFPVICKRRNELILIGLFLLLLIKLKSDKIKNDCLSLFLK